MNGSAPCVVVVGEALVDEFADRRVVGGAPFNVARTLMALGIPVLMVTRIGDDEAGALVRESFARYGLSTDGLQIDATHPTGRVLVERHGDDHRFEILANQAWDHLDADAALHCIEGRSTAAMYCGTLAQRSHVSRSTIRRLLGAVAAPHVVDVNLRAGQYALVVLADTLGLADTVKVNEEELRSILGWFVDPAAGQGAWNTPVLEAAVRALMVRFDLGQLIVTRGADGASCFFGADGVLHAAASAPPAQWGDAVGAGDAFAAVFLAGTLQGWPLDTTLRRANDCAAAICGIVGAVPDDPGDHARWRAAWQVAGG